jgi:hypothetical protein
MNLSSIMYQVANLLIAVVILGFFFGAYVIWQRWKNNKEVEGGKILCHFFGPSGWYYTLCRRDGNLIQAPESHDTQGDYLIVSGSVYSGKWKPGQIKLVQVGVPTTCYIEGQREPVVAQDPREWIANPEKHKITSFIQKQVVNQSAMKTAVAMQTGVWKDIASMAQFIKNVPYMFYISIALLVGMLIIGYLVYMCYASVLTMRGVYSG